jgi:peptidoglycan/xylan/chitin deacetylase (PgdA/CDA1 family)
LIQEAVQKTYFNLAITIAILFTIILCPLLPVLDHNDQQSAFAYQTMAKNQITNRQNNPTISGSPSDSKTKEYNDNNNLSIVPSANKVVILNFYDDVKSQFTNAKPILDKYGFKGTFFIVCNWAGAVKSQTPRMTWQDINQLYREGHDIESHTMTHKRLNKLSASALDYEVGQSKQCIHDHIGVMPTIFSPPHSIGWNNATVINTIAKYYNLSIGGFVNDVMFLHCYGWKQQQHLNQRDCRTYSDNGTLNYANRYDIKENPSVQGHSNDTLIFNRFANLVNREMMLNNNNGNNNNNATTTPSINSVLILGYHNIDNNLMLSKDATDIALFDKEMKYLHEDGFKVITMSDIGYDENSKNLYIKGVSR